MKILKKVVALLISLSMISAGSTMACADNDEFLKCVLIECGRGAYTVSQIKTVIDKMSACDYNCLMLGFGNDGLRFVLDDMSVTADGKTYDSDTIRNAVIASNDRIAPEAKGQFTESGMDEIMAYASEKNIEIIPMLDIPGHATAITEAAAACGIENASFIVETGNDAQVVVNNLSVNIENETAKDFTAALVLKYAEYFSNKGCRYFNLGCDEYGGNADYLNADTIVKIRDFIADICARLPDGMTPLAFTDVLTKADSCPQEIIGINWAGGKLEGHRMLNANDNWYYVLSYTGYGWSAYDKAMKYTKEIPVTQMINDDSMPMGSIIAIWNDKYLPADDYMDNICSIIENQAVNNPEYFNVNNTGDNAEDKQDDAASFFGKILNAITQFFKFIFSKIKSIFA